MLDLSLVQHPTPTPSTLPTHPTPHLPTLHPTPKPTPFTFPPITTTLPPPPSQPPLPTIPRLPPPPYFPLKSVDVQDARSESSAALVWVPQTGASEGLGLAALVGPQLHSTHALVALDDVRSPRCLLPRGAIAGLINEVRYQHHCPPPPPPTPSPQKVLSFCRPKWWSFRAVSCPAVLVRTAIPPLPSGPSRGPGRLPSS